MFTQEEDVTAMMIEDEPVRRESMTYEEIVKDFIMEETQYLRDLNMIIKVFRAPFADLFPRSKVKCWTGKCVCVCDLCMQCVCVHMYVCVFFTACLSDPLTVSLCVRLCLSGTVAPSDVVIFLFSSSNSTTKINIIIALVFNGQFYSV